MHVCARRSTGPVDRSAAAVDGRPDRSTVLLLLLLITSAAADSFGDDIVDFLDFLSLLTQSTSHESDKEICRSDAR